MLECMGKVVIHIPLVTWREGRPRYWPSKAQRELGFRGEDLRHPPLNQDGKPVGAWYSLDEAIKWSNARQEEIAKKREAVTTKAFSPARPKNQSVLTVGELLLQWQQLPKFKGKLIVEGRRKRKPLGADTVRFYRGAAKTLEKFDDGYVWFSPANALTPRALDGILEKIEVAHGLGQARAVRATLSTAYKWAILQGKANINPAAGVALPVPDPRLRCGEPEEIAALVKAADDIGRPEIGDSIMLGVWTGQRQADRLQLQGGQILKDGILFRQAKKNGAPLLIPVAPELASRLEAAKQRRREWRVNYTHVVLDEKTRRPFEKDWYRKVYREVREEAEKRKLKVFQLKKILRHLVK